MGYLRGLVHGAIAGTVLGLSIAPQTGDRTRAQLRQGVKAAREGAEVTARALKRVAPVASYAVERVRHHSDGEYTVAHGNGTGTVGVSPSV